MKKIVTHLNPDLDALSSVWAVTRYFPGFGDSPEYSFVPAGTSPIKGREDEEVDTIVVVDTGLGKFDHHQFAKKTCAFEIVIKHIIKNEWCRVYDVDALKRMVSVIRDYDNFAEVYYPDIGEDYQIFHIDSVISGLSHISLPDTRKVELTLPLFDSILQTMKNKIKAEKNVKEGTVFETQMFGKSILMENENNDSMKYAQKNGFGLVARRDPARGSWRIVCLPDKKFDLTGIYKQVIARDSVGSWFFHKSRHMLINGSTVNPHMVPSPLTVTEVLDILQKF